MLRTAEGDRTWTLDCLLTERCLHTNCSGNAGFCVSLSLPPDYLPVERDTGIEGTDPKSNLFIGFLPVICQGFPGTDNAIRCTWFVVTRKTKDFLRITNVGFQHMSKFKALTRSLQ